MIKLKNEMNEYMKELHSMKKSFNEVNDNTSTHFENIQKETQECKKFENFLN